MKSEVLRDNVKRNEIARLREFCAVYGNLTWPLLNWETQGKKAKKSQKAKRIFNILNKKNQKT